jgi:nucleotide-binding universal stress UspA family protein
MFKTIMLATDGSKLSQKATKSAIDMAAKFSAELVAVKVIPRYVQTYFEGSFTVADIDVKSIEAQWAAGLSLRDTSMAWYITPACSKAMRARIA